METSSHLRSRRSTRRRAVEVWLCALPLIGACSARVPIVTTGPAGPDSVPCATPALALQDYQVDRDVGAVTGEARLMSGDLAVSREFITVAITDAQTMTVAAEAFRLEPATHSLPVQRQTATAVRPSDDVVELANRIVEECSG